MRILILSNLQPHPAHSVRAANIVAFELLSAIAAEPEVECGFLHVREANAPAVTATEAAGADTLRAAGVHVLQPVVLKERPPRAGWRRLFVGGIEDYYPQVEQREHVWRAVASFAPDVILIPWCEWLTALCADMPVPKFAYYGNPDAKSARARLSFARAHGEVSWKEAAVRAWDHRLLERAHLRQMMKYEMLGDVAANDAAYYVKHGHPNAFYVRNLWIDRWPGDQWRVARRERERPGIIIGNIGRLPGTGNTLGLELLGRDLLPRLAARTNGMDYRVRILGAGTLHPTLATSFDRPEVELAGFVPDIDGAILEAGVFLCLNNASSFKVGQTRYLHAWSLGACVIAHRDAALSMPEIQHGVNALLGASIEEIADLIVIAMQDAALRRRVGEAGYETFTSLFTARNVSRSILQRMDAFRRTVTAQTPAALV